MDIPFVGMVTAALGSSVLTAGVTALVQRSKAKAEAEEIEAKTSLIEVQLRASMAAEISTLREQMRVQADQIFNLQQADRLKTGQIDDLKRRLDDCEDYRAAVQGRPA